MDIQTPRHKKYYISFMDNHTHYTHVFLQTTKSDMFESYKAYKAWAKMQHDTTIKQLCSDHGGEYLSNKFNQHLKVQGTEQKLTVHDTLQHNSVAERLNCTLLKHVRLVLHASGLLKTLWREALVHTVWVKNHTTSQVLNSKMPYELLHGKCPNLHHLLVWGTCV